MRNKQYEPGFGLSEFKELLKNYFYPMSLKKAKEDELVRLQQEKMSVLEYASKFMKPSHFAPTNVTNEKLRMNPYEVWLKPGLRERMLI